VSVLGDLLASGWAVVLLALVLLAQERLRAQRRRIAVGRALHELRRPLGALMLGAAGGNGSTGHLELAWRATDEIERAVDGGSTPPRLRPLSLRPLVEATVARWAPSAAMAGSRVGLRWRAGAAWVMADPHRLSQALDNLVANALEHGGPPVELDARLCSQGVRIAVADGGAIAARGMREPARPLDGAGSAPFPRDRHGGGGHGLEVVRTIATEHGGRFALRRGEAGSVAVLEVPLAERPLPAVETAGVV
jgi:signal transduction histidine kinase